MQQSHNLKTIYQLLLDYFGPQGWWPSDSPFEVVVGTILTQNTNWTNVTKAIDNLKTAGLLSLEKMRSLPPNKLAKFIRPAGYYNLKEKRLRNLLNFLAQIYPSGLKGLAYLPLEQARAKLLQVKGVGAETADSILLYACNQPSFVIDSYTIRILSRHSLTCKNIDYNSLRNLFMDNLPHIPSFFNEFHALFVKLAKDRCKKKLPLCHGCPLENWQWNPLLSS